MSQQIPEWALPLVERVRNAIVEKQGDVDCVAVLQAVLDGQSEIRLPDIDHRMQAMIRATSRSLARDLREAS